MVVLYIVIFLIIILVVFSGLSIEDFSNFFSEVFGITRDSAEVQNIQEEEVQKILTSNDVESNKEATNEVENKKVLSNKQRFFYFCVFLGLLLVILFGITFFTGTSVPENVDGTVTEAVVHSVPENIDGTVTEAIAHSADDSNSLSYSEDEYSDEFYAWCEENGYDPNPNRAPVTEVKTFKRLDGFCDEESLD